MKKYITAAGNLRLLQSADMSSDNFVRWTEPRLAWCLGFKESSTSDKSSVDSPPAKAACRYLQGYFVYRLTKDKSGFKIFLPDKQFYFTNNTQDK